MDACECLVYLCVYYGFDMFCLMMLSAHILAVLIIPFYICLRVTLVHHEVQYSRDERFFAFKRFAVIVVIMVADVIFISTSHMVLLLFKAFRAGDLGTPEAPVRALVEVAFLLGFMQGPGG